MIAAGPARNDGRSFTNGDRSRVSPDQHIGSPEIEETGERDHSKDLERALTTALEKMEQKIAASLERARRSVVSLEYTATLGNGARRIASGVVVSDRGDVIAVRIDPPTKRANGSENGSEVYSSGVQSSIVACDFTGRRHVARWVAFDPQTGLTLLRISGSAVPPIPVSADSASLGSQIFVIGNPFGMGQSVSRGSIAAVDRIVELGRRPVCNLIQLHSDLYPGDSGAAVVNLRGEWVGLIRGRLACSEMSSEALNPSIDDSRVVEKPMRLPPSKTTVEMLPERDEIDHEIGFAVPARNALWVAEQLRKQGHVPRSFLGVRLRWEREEREAITGAIEKGEHDGRDWSTDTVGVVVDEVLPNTPAASVGIRPGDRIVSINDEQIRTGVDLTNKLELTPAKSQIILDIVRNGESVETLLRLSVCTTERRNPVGQIAFTSASAERSTSADRRSVPVALTAATAVPGANAVTGPAVRVPNSSSVGSIHSRNVAAGLPRGVTETLENFERRLERLESEKTKANGHSGRSNPRAGAVNGR
jgi:S1-C subfamily serine protease